MRCPRLDPIFKLTLLQKEVRTGDAELERVQALMHDPVAPLIHLLHACDDVDTPISIDEAKEAVVESIQLLGNASVGLSRLRRKRLLKSVNPDIADLAEEIFEEAAPNLFGSGFEKKMKAFCLQVKPPYELSAFCLQVKPPYELFVAPVFSKRPSHCPPKRRRPSEQGEVLAEKTCQEVTSRNQPRVRDSKIVIYCLKNQSLISLLVQRGVAPLAVDKSIIAGRVALFQENWSRVSEDQWLLDTIQGYKIEFVDNPTQARQPRVGMSSPTEQALLQEEVGKMLSKRAIVEVLAAIHGSTQASS